MITDGNNCLVRFEFNGYPYPPAGITVYGQAYGSNEFLIKDLSELSNTFRKISGGGTAASPTFMGNFTDLSIQLTMATVGSSAGLGQRAKVAVMFRF